jgi:cobalt/nickel transport system permease protein
MHLPDGTLGNTICTVTAALSAGSVALALSRIRTHAGRRNLARAGIGAAVVFGAQMFDVPLFGGVGVHLIGAAFLTLLSGPVLALLGMTTVIVVQALVLGDGGITTLGANVFNMGVVAVGTAYAMTRVARTRRVGASALLAQIAAASAASVLAAVTAMSIELAFSGTSAQETMSVTMSAHAPFALFETVATVVLVIVAARLRAFQPTGVTAGTGE